MFNFNYSAPANPTFSELLKSPVLFLAFGFGSGLSKIMPGTMGTIAALPLYYALAPLPLLPFLIVILVSFIVGCYLCDKASKAMNVHDHPGIVWDEFVGLWITFILVPFSWSAMLAGFILFRIFDMAKPWPIKWVDKHVHGGIGIMVDDVLAGIAACVCLHILLAYQRLPLF